MEVADRIVVLQRRPDRAGRRAARALRAARRTTFVMGFLGRVVAARRHARAPARPRALRPPRRTRWRRRWSQRVVHLGFEVRVELVLRATARRSRRSSRAPRPRSSSSHAGDIVWRAARRARAASAPDPRLGVLRRGARPRSGRSPAARSASVTCSTTPRRLARTAIQTSLQRLGGAGVVDVLGRSPRTEASGPSTARMTSATVISSAGWASQ